MATPFALQRLTTQFVAEEDRLRVAGALNTGQTRVFWLTQRLLLRLLPALVQRITTQDQSAWPSDLVLGFQQDAARAAMAPQPAVVVESHEGAWLVDAVDVVSNSQSTQLRFRGLVADQQAEVVLDTQALRQWLDIVYEQFLVAQWPMNVWPAWMGRALTSVAAETLPSVLH